MICVAVNNQTSLGSIQKWKTEINSTVQSVPIILVLTKKDLAEFSDDPVTDEELKEAKKKFGLTGVKQTSSKEWEDFNVHKAFVFAIAAGIDAKYNL